MLRAIFILLAIPTLAAGQSFDGELQRLRDHAEETGDTRMLASFALDDYADAAGFVDGCTGSDHEGEISKMAYRFAKWAEPGIWPSISGSRSDLAAKTERMADLGYSASKLDAVKNGCDRPMLATQRRGLKVQSDVFDRYLEGSS